MTVLVTLAVLLVVRASAQIVETALAVEVVISAGICARAGRHRDRVISKARAVSVVRVSAFRRFVITVTVTVQPVHVIASARRKHGEPTGIALPVNAIRGTVVLVVVVTETFLVVTFNVLAGATS